MKRVLQVDHRSSALAVALLVASGAVDVRVSVRDGVARAIDLFGQKRRRRPKPRPPAAVLEATAAARAAGAARAARPSSFADLAERVSPGVVNIQTKKTRRPRRATASAHPFEDLFGRQFGGWPARSRCRASAPAS